MKKMPCSCSCHGDVPDTPEVATLKARIAELGGENASLLARLDKMIRKRERVRQERDAAKAREAAMRSLMKEARDTAEASTAENGVSDARLEYRRGLVKRLDAALSTPAPDILAGD